MAVEASIPHLGTVLITGALDSINPCAIGVFILLLSTLIITKRKEEMWKFGFIYIFSVFVTYLLFGLGLLAFMANIPIVVAEYISVAVGLLVVIAGLFEIKDFFWYGEGFSLQIPKKYAKKIEQKMHKLSGWTVVFLGVFVSSVELPCTGGPYLAIILLLSQNFDMVAFLLLVLYNIVFVLPLIVILAMVLLGTRLKQVHEWKQANKAFMRYFVGLILISLGWLLMLIASGIINLN